MCSRPISASGARATVAGNLPYYAATPIIEKTLSSGAALQRAVFLVQKEVAARLAARPGTRDYGYLSVQTQLLAEVEALFDVRPSAFRPPPKVDSTLIRLRPRNRAAELRIKRHCALPGFCEALLPPQAQDPAQQSRRRLWKRRSQRPARSRQARGRINTPAVCGTLLPSCTIVILEVKHMTPQEAQGLAQYLFQTLDIEFPTTRKVSRPCPDQLNFKLGEKGRTAAN